MLRFHGRRNTLDSRQAKLLWLIWKLRKKGCWKRERSGKQTRVSNPTPAQLIPFPQRFHLCTIPGRLRKRQPLSLPPPPRKLPRPRERPGHRQEVQAPWLRRSQWPRNLPLQPKPLLLARVQPRSLLLARVQPRSLLLARVQPRLRVVFLSGLQHLRLAALMSEPYTMQILTTTMSMHFMVE